MPEFKWSHFLNFSEEIFCFQCNSENEEAKYRTIVSRAYYAAFHSSSIYLLENYGIETNVKGEGSHDRVIRELMKLNVDPIAKKAAEKLKLLKNSRKYADYNIDEKRNKLHAETAIMQSKEIILSLR